MHNASMTQSYNPDAADGPIAVEEMDPAAEYAFWRDNFANRPYVGQDASFDDYGPAYVFGIHASEKFADREFDEVESDLAHAWPTVRDTSRLEWAHARRASRDSWEHSRRGLGVSTSAASVGG